MMTKIFTLPFFLFLSFITLAQQATFSDVKTFGSTGNQVIHDMAVDPLGNILLCGRYESGDPNDFNPGENVNSLETDLSYNGFVSKWTPDGIFLWAIPLQGSGNARDEAFAITSDSEGNVIVTGIFNGALDFDPGPNEFIITANSSASVAFVLKLNQDGAFQWAFKIDATIFYPTTGEALAVDSENNIIVGGTFSQAPDFDPGDGVALVGSNGLLDCFIAKYSPDAEMIWVRSFGSTSTDYLYDLAVDGNNNIYSTGYLGASADMNTGVATLTHDILGSVDSYLHKLNSAGEFVTYLPIAGEGNDQGFGVTCDETGRITVTGAFTSAIDLDPGEPEALLTEIGGGWQTAYIVQYNADLTINWYRSLPGVSEGYEVAMDDFGNTTVAGYYIGTMDLDPGDGITSVVSNGFADVFMIKFDSQGQFLNGTGIGGIGDDRGVAVIVNNDNLAVVAGFFDGEVDFDPTPLQNLISSISRDGFVVTLNACSNVETIITESACDSFTLNEVTYDESGVYTQSFLTGVGCDSLVVLHLTILEPTETVLEQTACELFILNDITYTETGVYSQVLQNFAGCDSIVVLNLTIPVIEDEIEFQEGVLTATQQGANYQWLNCELKGSEIDGATAISFTPAQSGSYSVRIEMDGCQVYSECLDVIVLSMNELTTDQMLVYPNPNNGTFRLNHLCSSNARINIRSIADGRMIMTSSVANTQVVEFPDLACGTYLLELIDSEKHIRSRLVVID